MLDKLRKYASDVRDKDAPEKPGTFLVNLSGVSFDLRPLLIKNMTNDTLVRMARERTNEYDFYAVAVEAQVLGTWAKIGYLPTPFNVHVARDLDNDLPVSISLHQLVGEYPACGVRVRIDK